MSRRIWLTLIIAGFALLVLVVDFACVLLLHSFGTMPPLTSHWRFEFLVGALWFVPIAAASYGIFRQLLKKFSRRESRSIGTVFGLTSPFAFGVGFLVSSLTGSFVGAIAATVLLTTVIELAFSALTLKVIRLSPSI